MGDKMNKLEEHLEKIDKLMKEIKEIEEEHGEGKCLKDYATKDLEDILIDIQKELNRRKK